MSNPVRIYVLYHPESKLGQGLTDRIYDWFRLPSLEGIPVYVRSAAASGKDRPAAVAGQGNPFCVDYIVPLVDAHMVRDPVWHDYLSDIAKAAQKSPADPKGEIPDPRWVIMPVALDGTAFNLPDGVARMNFIRHGSGRRPVEAVLGKPTKQEQEAQNAHDAIEAEETLKHLTEALARDLHTRLFKSEAADRFKIFISYARADGTEVPKALRNYIQGQTQCMVFFDENDIGFGRAYDESLDDNVSEIARAMIVVNGDHYAERPWCRWEIQRFTRPRNVALVRDDGDPQSKFSMHAFQPVLVVDNMAGSKITRMVPEMAQSPVVRWAEGRERACFIALMREVVFGLRDVLVAKTMPWKGSPQELVVNRLPGPVALAQLLLEDDRAPGSDPVIVHHPGHGLPLAELRLLKKTFSKVNFQAFRDINRDLPPAMQHAFSRMNSEPRAAAPLKEKVIAISTAHNRPDLAALGLLSQHQDEALIHLLRPLLRLGADLMYGGFPANSTIATEFDENVPLAANRNITLTLLQLLGDERRVVDMEDQTGDRTGDELANRAAASASLLFNICAWPLCLEVTAHDEAAWINGCRIVRVMPKEAGLEEWTGRTHFQKDERLPWGFRRHQALTLSHLRNLLADGFGCPVPGKLDRHVRPAAFVFIGGALQGFKGVMPGVMEEFLRAAQARPVIPIYLVGGLGGATGILAKALLDNSRSPPRPELTQAHYESREGTKPSEYHALMCELSDAEVQDVRTRFEELRSVIQSCRGDGGSLDHVFSNGLDHADNKTLLETTNTFEAVGLIWKGMSRALLQE